MATEICNVSLTEKNKHWVCCANNQTPDLANCEQVSNFTNYLAGIENLSCFNTSWYKRTTGGAISYYKNTNGYYYCTQGGDEPITGTGCNPIPLLNQTVVSSNVNLMNTTHGDFNTLLCKKVSQPSLPASPIKEPLVNFKASIFKVVKCVKTYYDYNFKKETEFTINIKDYNARNFIKNGNYLEVRDGTGLFSDDKYDGLVMSVPFNGINIESINMLTTILSKQLIKFQCKCPKANYVKMMLKIGRKMMRGYVSFLIKKIETNYNLSFQNESDKKSILIVIDYLNKESPFIKFLFNNWYVSQNEGTRYCNKLNVKMTFVYKMIVKLLKKNDVTMSDEIIDIFYELMWKTLICCKKISINKINALFYPLVNVNLFSKDYCVIFKKWFCFVNSNDNMHELVQMEIAFDRLSTSEQLKASSCPESPNFYLTLCEKYMSIVVIKDKMQLYIRNINDVMNTPSTFPISDEEKQIIIAAAMEKRLEDYTQQ